MAIREVVIYPDDRLRITNTDVTTFDDDLKVLIKDMFDTMYDADGIGLAAPQIGVNKRIAVIDIPDTDEEGNILEHHQIVLINPKIVERNGEIESTEGCLSLPNINETVLRSETVTVEAVDEEGKTVRYEAKDLLAVCIQHELDHLDGKVFIDTLSSLKRNRITKKLNQFKKEQQKKED